jgi:kynurenine formamidase
MRIVDLSMTVEEWDSTPFAVEHMITDAVVLDLSFRGKANVRITPEDLAQAERALNAQGHRLEPGGTVLLRTDWPRGHVTTDPAWWNESPGLTKPAAEWLVARQPAVLGYDFAQEEKGGQIPSKVKLIALPAKWRSESAPARVLALVD